MRHPRIMVYGTYPQVMREQVERLLSEFVETSLKKEFRLVTRQGAAPGTANKWPHAKPGVVPVDNIILQKIAEYCTARRKPEAVKRCVRTYVRLDRTQPIKVGQEFLKCPERRYEMYSVFLEDVDEFVFIGGGDGVLRLGLLCHFLEERFVAVTAYGGAAKELGDSLYGIRGKEHYQNLRRDDCLRLGSRELSGKELHNIVVRNLRSRLLFAIPETLRGRMQVKDLLAAAVDTFDHWTGRLAKITIVAAVAELLFLIYREEMMSIYMQVQQILQKLGLFQGAL